MTRPPVTAAGIVHLIELGTLQHVVSWKAFEEAAPDLADRVRTLFDAGKHKTIATLRADGSPRISGIECEFDGGELRFGSMVPARKHADLVRDPRFAIHSPSVSPVEGKEGEWPGEAKITGRASLAPAEPPAEGQDEPGGVGFVCEIAEVVLTKLNDEANLLVIEWWTPDGGRQRAERA